ncbi:MAG: site-specific DNA-methyltransferase [Spirochaetales bacterium]|nr:site-specific DNA-methyltransferase [Spirochaetales bacterium]
MTKETLHTIHYNDSRDLSSINDETIDLVVTSPPYPMIQMWDDLFVRLNPEIAPALGNNDGIAACELMHRELDKVWAELYRVVKNNRFVCINIGDATRTIGDSFRLYSNHSRIIQYCMGLGFEALPLILWRKPTNAPNKFMGSGMYPAGGYVTLEHEYIIILRKKGKRIFTTPGEKQNRRESACFWEERNTWFSDIWTIAGMRQKMKDKDLRSRSAAFPFELACRLINMYSVYGDMVLDPFLGTGTSMFAAMASCRNSTGIEIERNFHQPVIHSIHNIKEEINQYVEKRIARHREFVAGYPKEKLKYINTHFNFPVMTKQEQDLVFYFLDTCDIISENSFKASHIPIPMTRDLIGE